MKTSSSSRYLLPALCVGILLLAMTVFAGCTQPAPAPATPAPQPIQIFPTATPAPTQAEVSAMKPDSSHIVITYNGGSTRGRILELDATVTDSRGQNTTQHIGDKLATTPVGGGDSIKFNGVYSGSVHVIATGFFTDGSTRVMLETDL